MTIQKGFIIYLILLITSGCIGTLRADTKKKAPDFTIRTVDNKRITLAKLLNEGPVLLDFWALWCIPCQKELPHLQALHNKYKDNGLTVLTINQDDPSSESKVRPFIKGKRYTFQVAIDKEKEIWRKYKIVSLPTLFLIDTTGNIYQTHVGYRPGDEIQLDKEIDGLFKRMAEKGDVQNEN